MSDLKHTNGIHRAHTWEIGLYALNNTSTNLYLTMVGYIAYFLAGIVGVTTVLAGSIITIMRIWDGVTDPFVGYLVDKTNTKFGKNRPYIVIGNVILFVMTWLMFNILPTMNTAIRFPVFILMYMVYIIGYTFQCVVTKSAQSCLTNDPKQRPVFTMFDSVYNVLAMSLIIPVYVSNTLVPKYTLTSANNAAEIEGLIAQNPGIAASLTEKDGITVLSGLYHPDLYKEMQLVLGIIAAVFAVCAIIGLWRKDNIQYFGTGKVTRVGFKDYLDVMAHNRAIQMLVVSASSDKLSSTMMTNATIMVCLFGIICGNYAMFGSNSAITTIPIAVLTIVGVAFIARNMGQKKALVIGTWVSLASAAALLALFVFMDPMTMKLPTFSLTNPATFGSLFVGSNWSLFGVLFVLQYYINRPAGGVAGNIVIPMTADCADYEVYRSGRYVPGLMGTLFSFVDKLISSFATTFVALFFAAIGYTEVLPTPESPYSAGIFWVTMACFLGAPVVGWICNIVSMKFYPLTKEKMEEIQDRIAEIKAQAAKEK